MSIFERIDLNGLKQSKESSIESTLAKSLEKLVDYLHDITEFSPNELKAISLIQSDKYLAKLMEYFTLNKKHVKRKHSTEILEALKSIATTIGAMANPLSQIGQPESEKKK